MAGPVVRETVAVDDPALFAAYALYDALLRRGVAIRGRPVARHRGSFDDPWPVDGDVIHLSTFSKRLIPSLRVGYLVVPPALRDSMRSMKRVVDIEDVDTGTVRLKRDASKLDEMALDTSSTKTTRVKR